MDEDMIVIKRGENIFEGGVRRFHKGIRIRAKAHPSIEEMIKSWGTGSTDTVGAYGKYWIPVDSSFPLLVYSLNNEHNSFKMSGGSFTLSAVGQPIIDDREIINMSFLRLVGISNGAGVSFDVRGVFSKPEANLIREKIYLAVRQLYVDYLLPIDLNVVISTEEIRV